MRLAIVVSFLFAAPASFAQSNSVLSANVQNPAAQSAGAALRHEQEVRSVCIEGRRLLCGKILDVLPEGLIVDSGYTNLLREPLDRSSWLIPGTAQASRAENLIESKTPGAICVGTVLLTHTPKGKKAKPAKYDYVIVEAYPSGKYSYISAGSVHHTIRRFSASLLAAVQRTLDEEKNQP